MIEQRIERKLPVDAVGLESFRDWKLIHGGAFRSAFAPRRVNSIYFDSVEFANYADNVDGVSERTKVRLRWYGDTMTPAALRLECKQKRAGVSWKHFVQIDNPPPLDTGLRDVAKSLRSQLPADLRPLLDAAPLPVLWNCYERTYYSARNELRLTVDTNLAAADILRDRLDPRRLRPSATHAVIELKFPVARQAEMANLLGDLRLRVGRHSKYVSGIDGASW